MFLGVPEGARNHACRPYEVIEDFRMLQVVPVGSLKHPWGSQRVPGRVLESQRVPCRVAEVSEGSQGDSLRCP